jgi:hypothetical protein
MRALLREHGGHRWSPAGQVRVPVHAHHVVEVRRTAPLLSARSFSPKGSVNE